MYFSYETDYSDNQSDDENHYFLLLQAASQDNGERQDNKTNEPKDCCGLNESRPFLFYGTKKFTQTTTTAYEIYKNIRKILRKNI